MKKYKTDEQLVAACLKYKSSAQRALYDKYVQAMYNTVYRYTFNHHDTQDILQEAFTKVFKYLKNYDAEKGALREWIRKVHIRCALNHLKKKRISLGDMEQATSVPDTEFIAFEQLEAEYILQLIEALPLRDRMIFNLYHVEGYSHEEIAELLSLNVNSSRVYLARARKSLREKISAYQKRLSVVQ